MRAHRSIVVIALGLGLPAAAHEVASTQLRDGARTRTVVRLGPRGAGGLVPVRLGDPATGRTVAAFVDGRALIQVAPGSAGAGLWARIGVRAVRAVMPSIGLWLVEDPGGGDGLALAARLQAAAIPELREALPDFHVEHARDGIHIPPDDPRYSGQWFLSRMAMEEAWMIETGKPEVTVVVVDSGCDGDHPDLKAKLDPGLDVVDGDDDPSPGNAKGDNHGTACAGLVGAATDNGIGIAGACPGCRMRCVRLLGGAGGLIGLSADIDAFQFALDVDAAVVSNSWGLKDPQPVPAMLAAAIEEVHDKGRKGKGTLVVFAAGNDNRTVANDELQAVRGVLTVGAVNNFGEVAQFSNGGDAVAVVSPTGTLTTDISGAAGEDPGDYTASFGGTSSACPLVAGVAGLLLSLAPDKTADEIARALTATARQSPFARPDAKGHDGYYGYGQIVPAAALRSVRPAPPPMTMPAPSGCGCRIAAPRAGLAPGAGLVALLCLLALRRLFRRGSPESD
ncbi:MAG: serine protease [Myxococcales bacterium]|nr:serine protease [Myxococcales bacterium]